MHARFRGCLLVGWCALAGLSASASGSYVGGVIRPPVRIDSARYELGKAVFTGKAKLTIFPARNGAP